MLEQRCDHIWTVPNDVWLPGGIHFPGRMTVVRLTDGSLWLHSPVPIDDDLAAALEALGPVRHLVAPCQFHNLFLAAAAARWPEATVHLPPGLRERLPQLPPGQLLDDEVDPGWGDELVLHRIAGIPRLDEVAFFHRPSATLLVTDLVFHFRGSNWQTRLLLWLVGAGGGRLAQSRSLRLMTRDRAAAAASARTLLAWPFERVIMAHGEPLERDAHARLTEALWWQLAVVDSGG